MPKSVVILGGSYAGLIIAHKLLKYTYKSYSDFKVTIVTPSTHFFWNPASVRHVLPDPHCFSDDQLFAEIAPGFQRYPRGSFELVIGTAENIDEDRNEVYVKPTGGGSMTFHYTALVVCTGTTYVDAPFWKAGEMSFHEQVSEFDKMRARIDLAGEIVIGGGGPTGVEFAAELGQAYGLSGKKKITLIVGSNRVLNQKGVREDVSKAAEKAIEGYKVKLIKGTTVQSFDRPSEESEDGKFKLHLSNGETMDTDLYIPCAGVRANTSFLPKNLLAENGDLKVNKNLQAEECATRAIWGAGDCTNLESKQITHAQSQAAHLAANLDLMLRSRTLKPYTPKDRVEMFVALGKGGGVGQFGGFKVPSMVVSFFKSKSLLVEKLDGVATGSKMPMGGNL